MVAHGGIYYQKLVVLWRYVSVINNAAGVVIDSMRAGQRYIYVVGCSPMGKYSQNEPRQKY